MSKGKAAKRAALRDLRGIGPAMLRDFEVLGIHTVEQLAGSEGDELYERLNGIGGLRHDPCVLDTFRCAVAQARDPHLPEDRKNWWWWSRIRKNVRAT